MTYYGVYSNNDYRYYLQHHGIKGQSWEVRNGPPYPLDRSRKSAKQYKRSTKRLEKINKKDPKGIVSSAYDKGVNKYASNTSFKQVRKDVRRTSANIPARTLVYALHGPITIIPGAIGEALADGIGANAAFAGTVAGYAGYKTKKRNETRGRIYNGNFNKVVSGYAKAYGVTEKKAKRQVTRIERLVARNNRSALADLKRAAKSSGIEYDVEKDSPETILNRIQAAAK